MEGDGGQTRYQGDAGVRTRKRALEVVRGGARETLRTGGEMGGLVEKGRECGGDGRGHEGARGREREREGEW